MALLLFPPNAYRQMLSLQVAAPLFFFAVVFFCFSGCLAICMSVGSTHIKEEQSPGGKPTRRERGCHKWTNGPSLICVHRQRTCCIYFHGSCAVKVGPVKVQLN